MPINNQASKHPTRKQRDLLQTSSALWLWCLPVAALVITNILYGSHRLPSTTTGVILVIATYWIGAACYANGRSCGRLHCKIDGIALPLLGLVGLANLFHIISLSWGLYMNALAAVVILSFVVEYLDNRLNHKPGGTAVC